MPRLARLDAPGVFHHVMIRGIERRKIFWNKKDRTGNVPLPTLMRRLLTGYVIGFNKRHRRYGQLFQNRFKSIVCQVEDPPQEGRRSAVGGPKIRRRREGIARENEYKLII